MTIYTRTGDSGDTGLFGGGRVSKDHPRVQAYGTVDELNSVLGLALTKIEDEGIRLRLSRLQHDLFTLGAVLATPPPGEGRKAPRIPELPLERIPEMEGWIDEAGEEVGELREFILPGGTPGGAALHVARTVCRRAERVVVAMGEEGEPAPGGAVKYLNRLSDLFFALARLENHRSGAGDVVWRKGEVAGSPDPEAEG